MFRNLVMIILLTTLSACAYLQGKSSDHDALCQQLKGQIVMNGANASHVANANQRAINQQNAGKANLDRTYREEGCE